MNKIHLGRPPKINPNETQEKPSGLATGNPDHNPDHNPNHNPNETSSPSPSPSHKKTNIPLCGRESAFASHIKENAPSDFPKENLGEFISYWTEHGPNDKKMRFEKEKSFDPIRRLATWKKRIRPVCGQNQPQGISDDKAKEMREESARLRKKYAGRYEQ